MPEGGSNLRFEVPANQPEGRLDQFLLDTERFDSRHQIQKLIRGGMVLVNGLPSKPSYRIKPLQEIRVRVPPPDPDHTMPMPIPLRIVHEDKDLLVLDKPAGMVVHPAAGHSRDTLVNALLHHCKDLSGIGGVLRPGIVHRLDKGTSGLLVVAKNDVSHLALARQFHEHSILREYLGLVRGDLKGNQGSIEAPIGRHVRDRKKMSTRTLRGRDAITLWRVERRYRSYTLVRFTLKTGRTHQIRVHMKELGHPIVGDPVYGARTGRGTRAGMDDNRTDKLAQLERPFLHAEKLGFQHPRSSLFLQFIAPLPPELEEVLQQLAQDRSP